MTKKGTRNHGAYLLSRVGVPDEEIASRVGCSRPQVTNYRLGKLKPRAPNRGMLRQLYAIPESAWDEPVPVPPAAVQTSAQASTGADPAAPIDAAELQKFVNTLVRKVNEDPNATPHERAKVLRSVASTLQLLGKLTGETSEISEAKILRMPAWQRLWGRIVEALRKHPDAARAVCEALESEP